MSRFFSNKYKELIPYTPGEQPLDKRYIKLNTNESPFPPSSMAQKLAREAAADLNLYSDPRCLALVKAGCDFFGVSPDEILFTNSSDEALNFAFMAFCDKECPAAFADVSYGFYPVFARLNGITFRQIPLREDFTIDPADYKNLEHTIFIANPNAPTGIALELDAIEEIVRNNPKNVVVVDEAYVDFGAQSAFPLIRRYDNLLITQTFSKSRSLAGGRLGFAIGNSALINDLNTIKYSTNPYSVNRMSMAAGIGALTDRDYFRQCCEKIMETREYTRKALQKLGFECMPSKTNFLFARHPLMEGAALYQALRERGVLVRHFDQPRIRDYNRITVGTREQMQILLGILEEML